MGQFDIASCQDGLYADFLKEISERYPEEQAVMVFDVAGWHRSKRLKIPENIKLLSLPVYSPELNPVENIWKELREKYFHNRVFVSLDAAEVSEGSVAYFRLVGFLLYNEPSAQAIDMLIDKEVFSVLPYASDNGRVLKGRKKLLEWLESSTREDITLEARTEYMRLLIGIGKSLAPPWGSAYMNDDSGYYSGFANMAAGGIQELCK
jgi:hypothetical protein